MWKKADYRKRRLSISHLGGDCTVGYFNAHVVNYNKFLIFCFFRALKWVLIRCSTPYSDHLKRLTRAHIHESIPSGSTHSLSQCRKEKVMELDSLVLAVTP